MNDVMTKNDLPISDINTPANRKNTKKMQRRKTWETMKRQKMYYLFLLPAIVAVLVFNYAPMGGLVIAFQNYKVKAGFLGSEFVGLEHFAKFIKDPMFFRAFKNTMIINLFSIIILFPAPIILALMIDNIRSPRFKKASQTLTYLPHFVSWVIVATLVYRMVDPYSGIVNLAITKLGFESISFMRESSYFKPILIITGLWKEIGWSSIIYLAAISGIDPELYNAAMVDGAGKFRRIISITIPCIAPTIALMFILSLGSLAHANFDAVYNLMNSLVAREAEVVDTYVFRTGIQMGRYSYATAIGLSQSVFSIILVVFGFKLAKKYNDYSILD